MNKRLLGLLMSVMLLFVLAVPAFASENLEFSTMVVDMADILTDEQEAELDERALNLTETYGCAVYIVTTDTLGSLEAWEYSEEMHAEKKMGYGDQQSCVILLLSMEERDYNIMAHGYGNTAFTDYGKEQMAVKFLDEFGDDDWKGGFDAYLDCCEKYLKLAEKGDPFDVGDGKSPILGIALGVGVPLFVAFTVCSSLKAKMKTAKKQRAARNYIDRQGLRLTTKNDRFINTTRTERYIEPKKSSGSGTTVNSGGSSHKGGKF